MPEQEQEWKSLMAQHKVPRPMRVVLPAALGESAVLGRVLKAMETTRTALAYEEAIFRHQMTSAADAGRFVDAALWSGRVLGAAAALERMDGHVLGELDLWDQRDMQSPESPETVERMAGELEVSLARPTFPLPEGGPDLGLRMVEMVQAQRDALAAQAIMAAHQAVREFGADPQEGTGRSSPGYEEHMARARSYAMAADGLDELLARAHGADDAYAAFVEAHGSWLERLVFE